jgi:hypothetical protein
MEMNLAASRWHARTAASSIAYEHLEHARFLERQENVEAGDVLETGLIQNSAANLAWNTAVRLRTAVFQTFAGSTIGESSGIL